MEEKTMKIKRLAAMGMAVTMLAGSAMTVFAEEGQGSTPSTDFTVENNNDVKNGTATTPVNVTSAATAMSVTVPTSLPVRVSNTGEVTAATGATITNSSYGAIRIKSVTIDKSGDWTLVSADANLSEGYVNEQLLGFQLTINDKTYKTTTPTQSQSATASSTQQTLFPGTTNETHVIYGKNSNNHTLALTYKAVVAPLIEEIATGDDEEHAANVVFTVEWNTKPSTN
jgi:hypothetical protein